MRYKLVNPSDDYTFDPEDDDVATVTVLFLGESYGWDKDGVSHMFMFLNEDQVAELTALVESVMAERSEEVAEALRSLEIKYDERVESGANIEEWHDSHRTSMSDIRAEALALANAMTN